MFLIILFCVDHCTCVSLPGTWLLSKGGWKLHHQRRSRRQLIYQAQLVLHCAWLLLPREVMKLVGYTISSTSVFKDQLSFCLMYQLLFLYNRISFLLVKKKAIQLSFWMSKYFLWRLPFSPTIKLTRFSFRICKVGRIFVVQEMMQVVRYWLSRTAHSLVEHYFQKWRVGIARKLLEARRTLSVSIIDCFFVLVPLIQFL